MAHSSIANLPASEVLARLSADDIRARLDIAEAETKALKTLLRAVNRLERARQSQAAPTPQKRTTA